MKRRSATPWKKSRTYGDIHGGRTRRRMADNIFARAHSLQRPGVDEPLPVLIQENPSREFFFPATAQEFAEALARLPQSHREGITHFWLRRMRSVQEESEQEIRRILLAAFGSENLHGGLPPSRYRAKIDVAGHAEAWMLVYGDYMDFSYAEKAHGRKPAGVLHAQGATMNRKPSQWLYSHPSGCDKRVPTNADRFA